jgi:hypothetical protein
VIPLTPPTRNAPGPMRTPRRVRAPRRFSPPPFRQRQSPPPSQPARQPARSPERQPARQSARPRRSVYRRPPETHPMNIPAWAIEAEDIWFTCPLCMERGSHSGFVCLQCLGRPACCFCVENLEASLSTRGRCPFCRFQGTQ